jgi:hypothetical protein
MGSAARFNEPNRLAIDSADTIYVADTGNHTVRQITPEANVTTLAGLAHMPGTQDGTGERRTFQSSEGNHG